MSTLPTNSIQESEYASGLTGQNAATPAQSPMQQPAQQPAWLRSPVSPPTDATPPVESAPVLGGLMGLGETSGLGTSELPTSSYGAEEVGAQQARPSQAFQSFQLSNAMQPGGAVPLEQPVPSSPLIGDANEKSGDTSQPGSQLTVMPSMSQPHESPSVDINRLPPTAATVSAAGLPSPLSVKPKKDVFGAVLLAFALVVAISCVTLLSLCVADVMPALPDFSSILVH